MSNSSVPSPVYEELGKDEIRLLNVTRDENTKKISCIMTTYHLGNLVPYKALSYAWGSEDDQQAIEVNGHQVIVRSNLYDFLQIYDGGQIWIDQICINQGHLQEKNSQVAMMSQIYTSAEATLIWLGPDPHRGLTKRTIEQLLKEYDQFREDNGREREDFSVLGEDDFLWDSNDDFLSMKFFDEIVLEILDPAQIDALAALYEAPYWRRHWIAQEIKVAQKRLLWYGEEKLSWAELSRLSLGISAGMSTRGLDSASFTFLWHVVKPHGKEHADSMDDWYDIVFFSLYSHCTDPLDKIYGIQSLLDPSLRVEIDYNLSTRDLYLLFVENWFHREVFNRGFATSASDFANCCVKQAIVLDLVDYNKEWTVTDSFEEACYTLLEVRIEEDGRREYVHEHNRDALRQLLIEHILDFDQDYLEFDEDDMEFDEDILESDEDIMESNEDVPESDTGVMQSSGTNEA